MISGGELFDYVANSGPFSEPICRYYFKQMLQGLHYIHSKGFSHRDLKPENILLDKMFDVKIVDFGFACPLEGRDGSGTNRSIIGTPGYMAPEILLKQAYQGQVVDLFALGVILFILYSGHPPFSVADDRDNFYKLLATNRSDLFWKAHSNPQRKAENFYSDEFKDLITCMLQFHPHQRLCIADIIGHPWLANGNVAEANVVRDEFRRRLDVNKERARQEEERKQAQRNQVTNGPYRDVRLNGKVYLSTDDELSEEVAANQQVIRLNLKEYEVSQNRTHAFFSTFRPDYLLNQLLTKLNENTQDFAVSEKSWKINFEVKKQINDDIDEEQPATVPIFEQALVQVEIMKVPGKELYCVDFQRKAGSCILFYDNANKYIDLLELCNNATYEDNS